MLIRTIPIAPTSMVIKLLGYFPWHSTPKFHPLIGMTLHPTKCDLYEQRKQPKISRWYAV